MAKVYRFVEAHFIIPPDADHESAFGPLSGTSHEERVIRAYENNLLNKKQGAGAGADLKMCSDCGEVGHFPRYPVSVGWLLARARSAIRSQRG
ncbi:unnamed protein product [Chrysoparadoxa australica]